jgi:radical SAM protein with 4Fe4S-binding SPASM domain
VVWEITRNCNLRCNYCYRDAGVKGNNEATREQTLFIAEELVKAKVFHVTLSGGEPFLRDDLFDAAEILGRNGISVFVNSNGTLIDEKIAARIKKSRIKGVAISLDGVTAKTNDSMRKPDGSFERTLEGIRALRKNDVSTGIQTTITSLNHFEMLEMIDFAMHWGVMGVKFSRMSPVGRGQNNYEKLKLTYEIAQPLLSAIYAKKIELQDKFRIDFGENLISEFIDPGKYIETDQYISECEAGRFKCAVSPEGDIRPCEFFTEQTYIAGNMLETPLDRIWKESPVFDYFRTDNLYSDCSICRRDCRARCPAAALLKGDHKSMDPTCPYLLMQNA